MSLSKIVSFGVFFFFVLFLFSSFISNVNVDNAQIGFCICMTERNSIDRKKRCLLAQLFKHHENKSV